MLVNSPPGVSNSNGGVDVDGLVEQVGGLGVGGEGQVQMEGGENAFVVSTPSAAAVSTAAES